MPAERTRRWLLVGTAFLAAGWITDRRFYTAPNDQRGRRERPTPLDLKGSEISRGNFRIRLSNKLDIEPLQSLLPLRNNEYITNEHLRLSGLDPLSSTGIKLRFDPVLHRASLVVELGPGVKQAFTIDSFSVVSFEYVEQNFVYQRARLQFIPNFSTPYPPFWVRRIGLVGQIEQTVLPTPTSQIRGFSR